MSNDPQMATPQDAARNIPPAGGEAGNFSPQEFSDAMGDGALEAGNQAAPAQCRPHQTTRPAH